LGNGVAAPRRRLHQRPMGLAKILAAFRRPKQEIVLERLRVSRSPRVRKGVVLRRKTSVKMTAVRKRRTCAKTTAVLRRRRNVKTIAVTKRIQLAQAVAVHKTTMS